MILGRAVGVTKLGLFEAEHVRPGEPVGGRPAERAEPDDEVAIAASLHRAALIIPLLPVPPAHVSLGITLRAAG